jgi:ABC-type multidrug transport system fused ATPase/permease subunit
MMIGSVGGRGVALEPRPFAHAADGGSAPGRLGSLFGNRLRQTARGNREAIAKLTAFAQQVLGAIPLVQAFAAGARNLDVFRHLSRETVRSNVSMTVVNSVYGIVKRHGHHARARPDRTGRRTHGARGDLSIGSLLVLVATLDRSKSHREGCS